MTVYSFSALSDGVFGRSSVRQITGRTSWPTTDPIGQQDPEWQDECLGMSGNARQAASARRLEIPREESGKSPAPAGVVAGTFLETIAGPKRIEDIAVGDFVKTFDDGFQPVVSTSRRVVRRSAVSGEGGTADGIIWIGAGVLDNSHSLLLFPGQAIMIESDQAEQLFGDPFAVVSAECLLGLDQIELVPVAGSVDAYFIAFDAPQLVYCAGGALVLAEGQKEIRRGRLPVTQGRDRYRVFGGRHGQILACLADGRPLRDKFRVLGNFAASESGAVSVDFAILTAAAAALGAVMLSIIGPSAVELATTIGTFLETRQLVNH